MTIPPTSTSTAMTPAQPTYEQRVRGVARQFVSQSFYMPLLRELRENPLQTETSKMLSGGRGGEAFGAMLDEHRAKHLAKSTDGPIVDALVKRMLAAKKSPATVEAMRRLDRTA